MEPVKQLDYKLNEFESLGFFVEYIVDKKMIGTKNVPTNETGKIGYESTQHFTAEEDILFKNKKIKKGTNYYTRIYPLCGKPIINKQLNLKIMSKSIKIAEAPNYSINEQGEVLETATNKKVATVAGSVRLTVADGTKKSFKVSALKSAAFPESKDAKADAPKSLKFKGGKLEKVTDNEEPKAKDKKVPPAPKAQEPKSKKEGAQPKKPVAKKEAKADGEPTGAFLIREAYDKDPENFDMKKFSETSGISIARVKGCMKKYLVKLAKAKEADAK